MAAKSSSAAQKKRPIATGKVPVPLTKIIICGPHTVYLISKSTKVDDKQLEALVFKDEMNLAKKIKAKDRRDEFLRGRWLFHKLVPTEQALLRDKNNLPTWPANFIGSISHKDGHVILAYADVNRFHCVGVDIEKVKDMKDGFESKICNSDESMIIDRLEALTKLKRQEVLTLIFSFKEALYKAHFPVGNKVFHFHDVLIKDINPDRREVISEILIDSSPLTPKGHKCLGFYQWAIIDGEKFVITACDEVKPENTLKEKLLADEEEEEKKERAETATEDELLESVEEP